MANAFGVQFSSVTGSTIPIGFPWFPPSSGYFVHEIVIERNATSGGGQVRFTPTSLGPDMLFSTSGVDAPGNKRRYATPVELIFSPTLDPNTALQVIPVVATTVLWTITIFVTLGLP
jgi:hypothetical protein